LKNKQILKKAKSKVKEVGAMILPIPYHQVPREVKRVIRAASLEWVKPLKKEKTCQRQRILRMRRGSLIKISFS
jgi:hypothetical protein